jgi:hypothetical protein
MADLFKIGADNKFIITGDDASTPTVVPDQFLVADEGENDCCCDCWYEVPLCTEVNIPQEDPHDYDVHFDPYYFIPHPDPPPEFPCAPPTTLWVRCTDVYESEPWNEIDIVTQLPIEQLTIGYESGCYGPIEASTPTTAGPPPDGAHIADPNDENQAWCAHLCNGCVEPVWLADSCCNEADDCVVLALDWHALTAQYLAQFWLVPNVIPSWMPPLVFALPFVDPDDVNPDNPLEGDGNRCFRMFDRPCWDNPCLHIIGAPNPTCWYSDFFLNGFIPGTAPNINSPYCDLIFLGRGKYGQRLNSGTCRQKHRISIRPVPNLGYGGGFRPNIFASWVGFPDRGCDACWQVCPNPLYGDINDPSDWKADDFRRCDGGTCTRPGGFSASVRDCPTCPGSVACSFGGITPLDREDLPACKSMCGGMNISMTRGPLVIKSIEGCQDQNAEFAFIDGCQYASFQCAGDPHPNCSTQCVGDDRIVIPRVAGGGTIVVVSPGTDIEGSFPNAIDTDCYFTTVNVISPTYSASTSDGEGNCDSCTGGGTSYNFWKKTPCKPEDLLPPTGPGTAACCCPVTGSYRSFHVGPNGVIRELMTCNNCSSNSNILPQDPSAPNHRISSASVTVT